MHMVSVARLILLLTIVLTGCARTRQVARDAAVTTFRVIDAPANYVRRKLDEEEGVETTTTTVQQTEVGTSDVVTPGRPVPPRQVTTTTPPPGPNTRNVAPGPTPRPPRRETVTAPTTPAPQTDFPTARPVPGKPGFVYSISPEGGIVDVTGYKAGDKAKDPYTKQIFIVP